MRPLRRRVSRSRRRVRGVTAGHRLGHRAVRGLRRAAGAAAGLDDRQAVVAVGRRLVGQRAAADAVGAVERLAARVVTVGVVVTVDLAGVGQRGDDVRRVLAQRLDLTGRFLRCDRRDDRREAGAGRLLERRRLLQQLCQVCRRWDSRSATRDSRASASRSVANWFKRRRERLELLDLRLGRGDQRLERGDRPAQACERRGRPGQRRRQQGERLRRAPSTAGRRRP